VQGFGHLDSQLVPEQVLTQRDLPQRARLVARLRQAAHEQLVVALLEGIGGNRLGRERDRVGSLPGGQQRDRVLP
jgi:hypothetical protein